MAEASYSLPYGFLLAIQPYMPLHERKTTKSVGLILNNCSNIDKCYGQQPLHDSKFLFSTKIITSMLSHVLTVEKTRRQLSKSGNFDEIRHCVKLRWSDLIGHDCEYVRNSLHIMLSMRFRKTYSFCYAIRSVIICHYNANFTKL